MRTATNVCRLVGRRVIVDTIDGTFEGTLLLAGPAGIDLGESQGIRQLPAAAVRGIRAAA